MWWWPTWRRLPSAGELRSGAAGPRTRAGMLRPGRAARRPAAAWPAAPGPPRRCSRRRRPGLRRRRGALRRRRACTPRPREGRAPQCRSSPPLRACRCRGWRPSQRSSRPAAENPGSSLRRKRGLPSRAVTLSQSRCGTARTPAAVGMFLWRGLARREAWLLSDLRRRLPPRPQGKARTRQAVSAGARAARHASRQHPSSPRG
mmetsp:Transcript_15430/g.58389  ORF Transcript_15430/g.58389 Transcript_15430/m.58389 type:complete len:203 (+) Transcript_15430:1819-2427(+)